MSTDADCRHPSPLRRWLLLPYFLAWIALGVWDGSNAVLSHRFDADPPKPWHLYSWELSSVLVVGALTLLIARFERRFRVTGPGWPRRLPLHLAAAVVFSLLHVAGMVALRKLAYAAVGDHYDFGGVATGLFFEFQKDLVTYTFVTAACALVRVVGERRRQQIRELELRQALTDARLAHLSAQIEPHFIFNTLNAISNRMYEDVPAADRMLVALSDLLRAAMTADGSETVRVADEAHWLEAYMHLMAERQPGLLHASLRVDPQAATARLPRLLLQPLVENAFRHGLRGGRGRLWIDIERRGDRLHCRVEDDGAGLPGELEPGVGLRNIRERLQLLHPDAHRFELGAGHEGGTAVTVEIPFADGESADARGHRRG